MKRLLQELKEYKASSIKAPLFMIGEVGLELSLPTLMAYVIDNGVMKGDMRTAVLMGLVMLVVAFLSLVCGALSAKNASYASAGFVKNLRKAMFENIQRFSFRNVDRYSTAGLITRLMTDTTNVQNAYMMILRMCVRAPMMLILAMVMTFTIHADLAIYFLYALIFLAVALTLITVLSYPVFRRVFRKYDDLNASVQENITNMRVVKAYVKEEAETKKFKSASEKLYEMFCKAEKILVLNGPMMQLAMYACIMAIGWFGAQFVVGGSLTTGELMSMFTYTMQLLMSLMMLSMVFVMVSMSTASAKRIVEVLEETSDIHNPAKPVYEIADGSIRFENVSFDYYTHEFDKDADDAVLRNINLEIASGETIGILGGTGSAKSTLVQLIPRLYDVQKGAVYVGGRNVKEYDLDTLRNEVAMVLQKNVLFSGTIKDNLRWGNDQASDEEMIRACRLAQADEFISRFPDGYDTYIEQGGSNVSGGQKQRLCIARALLKKPKILILDDSTSAVDTKTDALIRKAFREDIPDTTKLIISQRISSIEDADRIVVLNDGEIDGIGTHEELLASNAIYQEIYETQKKGADDDE
ncbi:ABC transporter ATP-binding protein [Amedibacillus dolichus]|uniref:ABC transporter ATP-binding protein n=1 Tax=Amedibacillus dolichus TaxID=31971 RepID=A0ABT7UBS7_9FIRM|nr:ABC transporter ATP-binding protein [Amedibacillus dolichus]MDM8157086.1 ABC transporter ATP-binding protein [Amedibacillus dolichus]